MPVNLSNRTAEHTWVGSGVLNVQSAVPAVFFEWMDFRVFLLKVRYSSRALLCLCILSITACIPPKVDDASDLEVANAAQGLSSMRARLLRSIADRIANDPALGNGGSECSRNDFAFGVSKADYELDAFELRAKFLTGNIGCTDTRQTRPPLVLSSSNPQLKGLVTAKELENLGVKGGPAKAGEVIVGNFYHLKRFWIARIPMHALKKENIILQLEHFKITENQLQNGKKNGALAMFRDLGESFWIGRTIILLVIHNLGCTLARRW